MNVDDPNNVPGFRDEDWIEDIVDEDLNTNQEYDIFYFGEEAVLVPREVPMGNQSDNLNNNAIPCANVAVNGVETDQQPVPGTSKQDDGPKVVSDQRVFEPEEEDDPKPDYSVISTGQLIDEMNKIITEVNTIAQLPTTSVRILLTHFKWDKEHLLERYYSCCDDNELTKLFQEARIANPNSSSQSSNSPNKKMRRGTESDSSTDVCLICYEELDPRDLRGLSCGHSFCRDC